MTPFQESIVRDADATFVETGETITVPVIEETLTVGKRVTESGGVRIVKTVTSEDVVVNEPTIRESANVSRVSVNRTLADGEPLPKARQDGDTLIIPLFEEVYEVVKRTRLTEELHITMERTEEANAQTVTLRREQVHTEPIAPNPVLLNAQN